jgi:regulator of nucleoside diphosphate kinase
MVLGCRSGESADGGRRTIMGTRVQDLGRTAERGIFIADDDRLRLDALIRRALDQNAQQSAYLAALAGELGRARVVPRAEVPPDVVTMLSTVRLRDLETGEEETYTLVYPDEADIGAGRLSVLAPVGTALLGYRAGDVVEWPVPAGVTRFRIEEVVSRPRGGRPRVTA